MRCVEWALNLDRTTMTTLSFSIYSSCIFSWSPNTVVIYCILSCVALIPFLRTLKFLSILVWTLASTCLRLCCWAITLNVYIFSALSSVHKVEIEEAEHASSLTGLLLTSPAAVVANAIKPKALWLCLQYGHLGSLLTLGKKYLSVPKVCAPFCRRYFLFRNEAAFFLQKIISWGLKSFYSNGFTEFDRNHTRSCIRMCLQFHEKICINQIDFWLYW